VHLSFTPVHFLLIAAHMHNEYHVLIYLGFLTYHYYRAGECVWLWEMWRHWERMNEYTLWVPIILTVETSYLLHTCTICLTGMNFEGLLFYLHMTIETNLSDFLTCALNFFVLLNIPNLLLNRCGCHSWSYSWPELLSACFLMTSYVDLYLVYA